MSRTRYLLLLAPLLVTPAGAEWAKTDYKSEYEACLPACDKTNPRDHDKCASYCRCVTDAMPAQFLSHDQLMREAVEQRQRESVAAVQKIANRCNQRIWGNPARKLRLR